jgi:hypothetical protein
MEFVDSIGVNTHLHYTDTAYDDFAGIVKPRLDELGVRHVRDGVYTYDDVSGDTLFYRRIRALGQDGIRFDLITSIETGQFDRTDLTILGRIQQWADGAVEAFEGANEPDLSGADDWATQTRELQRDLWHTVANDPALQNVDVIGPSAVWEPEALRDVSSWTDYGNWHPYPGGECPGCSDVHGQGYDTRVARYRQPTGADPLIATETGYHNAVIGEQDHRPVSEQAAGKYIPRLLFEHFNRAVARTYIYELIDPRADPTGANRDEHFGLLRNDGSRKPAFIALRDLVEILDDPGPSFSPTSLEFNLSGNTRAVEYSLLQKRDGHFYLALWQQKSSYDTGARATAPHDPEARADVSVPARQITVTTPAPVGTARLFIPGQDSNPVRHWRDNSTISIDVPDHVVVLELTTD